MLLKHNLKYIDNDGKNEVNPLDDSDKGKAKVKTVIRMSWVMLLAIRDFILD